MKCNLILSPINLFTTNVIFSCRYREFLENPENTKQNFAFDYKSPIVVQSPFVFTSNMTKTMTEEDLQKFLDICEVSCEEISNIKLSPC